MGGMVMTRNTSKRVSRLGKRMRRNIGWTYWAASLVVSGWQSEGRGNLGEGDFGGGVLSERVSHHCVALNATPCQIQLLTLLELGSPPVKLPSQSTRSTLCRKCTSARHVITSSQLPAYLQHAAYHGAIML